MRVNIPTMSFFPYALLKVSVKNIPLPILSPTPICEGTRILKAPSIPTPARYDE